MWPFRSKTTKSGAETLRTFRSLEGERGILEDPVDVGQDVHKSCDVTELFGWVIFNPMGPTLSLLSLLRHDDSPVALVHHRMLNPFSQESNVVAALDSSISEDDLAESLFALFAQNEIGETALVGGLPTVLLFGGTRENVELCLQCLHSHVDENDRMAEAVDNLETIQNYLGEPWDRATHDHERALKALVASRTGEESPSSPADQHMDFDSERFMEWIECLLTDEHRDPEMRGFLQAWEGAIQAQGGNFLAQSALDTRSFLSLIGESCPFMMTQLAGALQSRPQ